MSGARGRGDSSAWLATRRVVGSVQYAGDRHMKLIRSGALIMTTAYGGLLAGCAAAPADDPQPEAATSSTQQMVVGEALAGIAASDFTTDRTAFNNVETVDDGLGPIFNERACGNCHNQGAAGGAGVQIERRFGRFDNGKFNSLASEGG